jgi:trehalose 6-phosphate phosphatase
VPDSNPPVVDAPLFFLDYDGTLAPIVDDPDEAVPHPDMPELLEVLDARHPLWVVTGRNLRSLEALLGMPLKGIGLHGAQQGVIGEEIERLMSDDAARALETMRRSVPEMDGMSVEDKEDTFAVHYRQVASADEARAALERWAEQVPDGLEVIWGKKVVELRPAGLSKGTAVRRVASGHPDRTPLYLGDDVTDEDAFAALREMDRRAVTVKVGGGETQAAYRLSGPAAVADYLRGYV